ncbi:hypothetical protein [Paramicrobacterium agarici]
MPSPSLLPRLLADDVPFAIIRRENDPTIDVLAGSVIDVPTLADIPLTGAEVLALVPFRQVAERGYDAHDDGTPLRCLVVAQRETLHIDDVLAALPQHPADVSDVTTTIDDETYAQIVQTVIDDEIGRGEGANFVIRRDVTARTAETGVVALLSWLRELLVS